MNDTELLKHSEQQRLTATEIISTTGIIPILSKYGKCSIVGSFSYDLMYSPDIDIIVETQNPRESSVKALRELVDGRQFQKYQYGDFEKFPRINLPKAFIIVLISVINEVKWETEIWFETGYPEDNQKHDRLIKDRLSPENKLAILRMKDKREVSGADKHKISSTDIYKAVLFEGKTDYEEIMKGVNKP